MVKWAELMDNMLPPTGYSDDDSLHPEESEESPRGYPAVETGPEEEEVPDPQSSIGCEEAFTPGSKFDSTCEDFVLFVLADRATPDAPSFDDWAFMTAQSSWVDAFDADSFHVS
eukprot:jgi/Mesvir1/27214/Mv07058-RA.1